MEAAQSKKRRVHAILKTKNKKNPWLSPSNKRYFNPNISQKESPFGLGARRIHRYLSIIEKWQEKQHTSGKWSVFQSRPSHEYFSHKVVLRVGSELAEHPGLPVEGNMARAASIYWDAIGGCWKLIGSLYTWRIKVTLGPSVNKKRR